MIVKFLGTGTSQGIPVIGCKCVACMSKDQRDKRLRTSLYLEVNDVKILIDTSPDFRQQMLDNNIDDIDFILYTHEHNDHTAGLDDVRPINFKHQKSIPAYGLSRVMQNLQFRFGYIFATKPYPGVPKISLNTVDAGEIINIKGINIECIDIIHGELNIIGYRINKLAYLTDVSMIPATSMASLKNLDVLIISALQMVSHHAHLSLDEAVALAVQIGAKETYLIHMSHNLGPVDYWEKLLPPNVYPAYDRLNIKIG